MWRWLYSSRKIRHSLTNYLTTYWRFDGQAKYHFLSLSRETILRENWKQNLHDWNQNLWFRFLSSGWSHHLQQVPVSRDKSGSWWIMIFDLNLSLPLDMTQINKSTNTTNEPLTVSLNVCHTDAIVRFGSLIGTNNPVGNSLTTFPLCWWPVRSWLSNLLRFILQLSLDWSTEVFGDRRV